jgi:dynamin 1-like protein
MAFEVLVRQQIARLLEPSLECAHIVYKELRDIVGKIEVAEIARF